MSLEDIKQKRMQELQERLAAQQQEQMQLQQQIEMLENIAKQHLDAQALSRYGNIKAAHPEKAVHVIALIAQAVNSGQIKGRLNDEQFKGLLLKLQPEKKEFKITRR